MLMTEVSSATTRRYNLGSVEQIPVGEGRIFRIGHVPVAVFRTRRGQVFATQALCPHRGGPLADGIVGETTLVCPLHAYRFDLSTGQAVGNECPALKTYPVLLSDTRDILLSLDHANHEHTATT